MDINWDKVSFEAGENKGLAFEIDRENILTRGTGKDEYAGPLRKVSRDVIQGEFARSFTPREKSISLYLQFRRNFKVGEIVPFAKLVKMSGLSRRMTAKRCFVLWMNGWLDKWAAGEYGGGKRGRYAGLVGRHHGVHYELIPKTEEEVEELKNAVL